MKERRAYVREMPERRGCVRFPIDQSVAIRFDHTEEHHAACVDLSAKGVLCTSRDPVDPLTRLSLSLQLPIRHELYELTCGGIVVRSAPVDDEYLFAVEYTDIDDDDLRAIDAYGRNLISVRAAEAYRTLEEARGPSRESGSEVSVKGS